MLTSEGSAPRPMRRGLPNVVTFLRGPGPVNGTNRTFNPRSAGGTVLE